MDSEKYLKLVQGFGLYHAIAILPFTLPIISKGVWSVLGNLHVGLGFAGIWPEATPTQLLFVNLFAVLACFWGWFRFRQPL